MSKPEAKPEAKPELVEAKLKKPHRHAGMEYPAGATVKITKAQAERLAAREVI